MGSLSLGTKTEYITVNLEKNGEVSCTITTGTGDAGISMTVDQWAVVMDNLNHYMNCHIVPEYAMRTLHESLHRPEDSEQLKAGVQNLLKLDAEALAEMLTKRGFDVTITKETTKAKTS